MAQRKLITAVVGLCGFLLTVPALASASSLSTTTLITPGLAGAGANGRFTNGNSHTLSQDGRITVFSTQAGNIVANDTNDVGDVFSYDRITQKTELISRAAGNQPANGESMYPSVSADGRFVAYLSSATNILPGVSSNCPSPNQCGMVLVYDRTTHQHIVASRANDGSVLPSYHYDSPVISGDGKTVAFATRIPTPSGVTENIFARNIQTNTTLPVSADNTGKLLRTFGGEPSISMDGRLVTFTTAEAGVANDTNGINDVYLRDTTLGTTKLVSAKVGGSTSGNSSSSGGVISSNGAFVAFHSFSSDLVANDTTGYRDVFLRNLDTNSTQRISVANSGTQGNFGSYDPDISDNGRFIVYTSEANNIVRADTNSRQDILLYDRFAGITRRVNVGSGDGQQANHASDLGVISGDGKAVVFRSRADNLTVTTSPLTSTNLFQIYNPVVEIPYYDPSSIIDLFSTAKS